MYPLAKADLYGILGELSEQKQKGNNTMDIKEGDLISFTLDSLWSGGYPIDITLRVIFANNRFVEGWSNGFYVRCSLYDMCNMKFLEKM